MQAECTRGLSDDQRQQLPQLPSAPRPGQCVVAAGSTVLAWAQDGAAQNVWLHNIMWVGMDPSVQLVDWSPPETSAQLWVTDCTFQTGSGGLRANARFVAVGAHTRSRAARL